MKQLIVVVLAVLITVSTHAQKTRAKSKFQSSLVVSSDVAYEFNSKEFQKSEFMLKPEFVYKLNRHSKFVFKGLIYSEFEDNLEKGKPEQNTVSNLSKRWRLGNKTDLELREFYFYTNLFKKIKLTLGKQQIVWGETDGLKLLDVINPQNLREFFLDDFEDSRIPLWSIKAYFDIKNIGVQLIWIPDNTYHILPELQSPYFTRNIFKPIPEGVDLTFNRPRKPSRFISDSDIGVKLTTFTKGWDISVNYLYYYDDLPVFQSNLISNNLGNPEVQINPIYKRQHLLGGTFNKVFGASTFRGEMVYIFNQNYVSDNPIAKNGIEQANVFKSALGIDIIKGESVLSAQVFNDWIQNDITPYNRDQLETTLTLLASQEMFNDNLKVEALWVHNTNHSDGYITPKISYWLTSNTQLIAYANLFYGDTNQLFGQFNNRNRMSIGFKWGI